MTFDWSIYWPVFAAMVSAFGVTEFFHISIGYYFHRKQERLRAEFERKVASGEIDPMQAMLGIGGPPGMGMEGFPGGLPTASGGDGSGPDVSHGQYL